MITLSHSLTCFCKFAKLLSLRPQKYKNAKNKNSNIFIILGALKSSPCFPLDIDVNDNIKLSHELPATQMS